MNILIDDIPFNKSLFPFGEVRSIAHVRLGIFTLFEKWQFYFPGKVFIASEKLIHDYNETECIIYPANFIPSNNFLQEISVAKQKIPFSADCKILEHPWQIFEYNDWAIRQDFGMITGGRTSAEIYSSNQVISPENIFLEPGAAVSYSVLNAASGPIYIGKNAEIQEGCLLRGPIAIGEGSRVKMGTKIYGATTIG